MEATTPSVGTESSEGAVVEANDTVTTDSPTTDGTADATTQSESQDESPAEQAGSFDDDLSDIPEEHKQWFQEHGNKRFQRYLTKHAQKKGADYKALQTQYETLSQRSSQLEAQIVEALKNPDAYNQYRRQYGYDAEPEPQPEIESVEDMVNYNKVTLEKTKKELAQKSQMEVRQEIQKLKAEQRYETAKGRLSTDPKIGEIFTSFEKEIVNFANTDPVLRSQYTGNNEFEVLQKASQRYYDEKISHLMERAKQERAQEVAQKKAATTFVPQTQVSKTDTSQGTSLSSEQIIARLKSKGLAY